MCLTTNFDDSRVGVDVREFIYHITYIYVLYNVY